jgi:hypothetical protein
VKYIANPVVVEAFEVRDVQLSSSPGCVYRLILAEDLAVEAGTHQLNNHVPKIGDFWIRLAEKDQYLCPKDVFERKYRAATDVVENWYSKRDLQFGHAIAALKNGYRVCRAGWNGKGMWLSYSPGSPDLLAEKFWSPHNRAFAESNGGTADVLPCITMKTATGEILMGWIASQSDMLAEDWMIVE